LYSVRAKAGHRNLKPSDPHITHFDRERGGKDWDAIPVDSLEGLVFDHIPLKQYAHGRVGTKDDILAKAEELGYAGLI
jgi:hypothetical protein